MFTGIVQEIGQIKSFKRSGHGAVIEVHCSEAGGSSEVGDSVAVNGVCLSITKKNGTFLTFDAVGNTLGGTGLKRLRPGDPVNLEDAMRSGEAIGGHIVTGHVDGERKLMAGRTTPKGWLLELALEKGDEAYLVPKGSIAVDGVSLTVGEITSRSVKIFLIPHTLENTVLKYRRPGELLNIEFDIMGKYAAKQKTRENVDMGLLRRTGFV